MFNLSLLLYLLVGLNPAVHAAQDTITGFEYDAGGNLTQVISPLNNVDNSVVTDYGYDALDRLKSIAQPSPALGEIRPDILLYHDNQDHVIRVDDPRHVITDYAVDGLGNRNAAVSPDSGDSDYTYDAAGNLKTHTDARGLTTAYDYDALNRLTQISYASGIPSVFGYDDYPCDSNWPKPVAIGQLTCMTDESGQTTYYYDALGRLRMKSQSAVTTDPNQQSFLVPGPLPPGSVWQSISYSYGATGANLGKLSSVTYPGRNRINYSYDAAGRINSVTLNTVNSSGTGINTVATPLLTNIKYTPTGQFQSGTWGNNTAEVSNTLTHDYDLDGRRWRYPLGNSNQGGIVRSLQFDPASRITSMSHTGTGSGAFAPANFDQSFNYDNLGRLTGNTRRTVSQTYGYDASGNRTTTDSYAQTIDPFSNRLQSTSGPVPAKNNQYDPAGNLISDGSVTYTYSDRGLLQTATKGGVTTTYTYNGLGQRITKRGETDASFVEYVYDEQGRLIGEYGANGNPIQGF